MQNQTNIIKELAEKSGYGTSLITLTIHTNAQKNFGSNSIDHVVARLRREYSDATNIKCRI